MVYCNYETVHFECCCGEIYDERTMFSGYDVYAAVQSICRYPDNNIPKNNILCLYFRDRKMTAKSPGKQNNRDKNTTY